MGTWASNQPVLYLKSRVPDLSLSQVTTAMIIWCQVLHKFQIKWHGLCPLGPSFKNPQLLLFIGTRSGRPWVSGWASGWVGGWMDRAVCMFLDFFLARGKLSWWANITVVTQQKLERHWFLFSFLSSPSNPHPTAGGVLHPQQQCYTVLEAAPAVHCGRRRIHSGAGWWQWWSVPGKQTTYL